MNKQIDAQVLSVLIGRAFKPEALPMTIYPIDLYKLTEEINNYLGRRDELAHIS